MVEGDPDKRRRLPDTVIREKRSACPVPLLYSDLSLLGSPLATLVVTGARMVYAELSARDL